MFHIQRLQHPTFEQPTSFKDFSKFLSTMVDTFNQICFHHDLQSTANVEQVLKKLPITARLEWNCHSLAAKVERPTLSQIAEWIEEYANACEDLPNITTKLPDTNYAHNSSDRQKAKNSQQQVDVKIKKDFCPQNQHCPLLRQCEHFRHLSLSQRLEHVKKLKLCFNCFSPYLFKDCKSTTTCRQSGCDKRHHKLLHQDRQPATITATTTLNRAIRLPSLLPILPVTLSCGSRTLDTYALLDSGSSLTLLTDAAARQLVPDLEPNGTITVAGVHSTNELLVASLQVTIGPYRSLTQLYTLDNVVTVPRLNLNNVQPDIINEICHKNPHLSHIVMPTLANKKRFSFYWNGCIRPNFEPRGDQWTTK